MIALYFVIVNSAFQSDEGLICVLCVMGWEGFLMF